MGKFEKADIRAALILAFLAAAAGFGRWLMDGAQADAAKLLSAVRHPLQRLDSISGFIVAAAVVAMIYFVWWLFLGRRHEN